MLTKVFTSRWSLEQVVRFSCPDIHHLSVYKGNVFQGAHKIKELDTEYPSCDEFWFEELCNSFAPRRYSSTTVSQTGVGLCFDLLLLD